MAHYATELKSELAKKDSEIAELRRKLQEFRTHLAGPKFQGVDDDGSRRDWISSGDVDYRLIEILQG